MNLARVRSERERTKKPKEVESRLEKKVFVPSSVSVGRLAHIFDVKIFNLQRTMQRLGLSEDQRRSDYLLTSEEACNIALEYGLDPTVDDERTFDIFPEPDAEGVVQPLRPPVVTIMGHVDHGKTTLLDSLRDSSVATGEAGGITQHIGAFSVPLSSLLPSAPADSSTPGTITFLDTPGHAAFTAMRARGASVTDMVVLVVAADDGVMPQTKEVIELWKADQDKVGLVVAINKCDKPGIDFDKIKSALGAEGILLEEDGGDVPSVRVSGLKKEGLDKLVETLSTLAEIRELRARTTGKMEGYVLESRVDRGQGNVATVLVSKGTLSAGTCIVAGTTWARVRQMQDSAGRSLRSAPPGTPVSIMGWRDLPSAGDQLLEASNEDEAKKAISNRLREIERKKLLADVESINIKRVAERKKVELEEEGVGRLKEEGKSEAEIQVWKREFERQSGAEEEGGKKELRLVVKGDVSGSVEAVVGSLEGIGNAQAGVKIVHVGVGEVGESDVHMAEAGKASIIAFSVPTSRSTQNLARTLNVPLHSDSVIYRLIETVRSEVIKLLPAVYESRVTGEAVVQQVFEIKMKGKEVVKIAGCKVGNGVVESKEGVGIRVLRGADRVQVYEGTIETLKHLKKDVTEVRKGTECGISFHGFTDVREGDEIIAFTKFEVPRHL
ncbi:uncharacterized protein MKK02DRAFT_19911 [Dioszegia hungarica]|uniref:Translation initiation factor IF-2, mitochondrial n=1 Tax=Dioszegia hungarica TaxID=4972 RepID=A0AA38H0W8_9TREE|nr:uncharacterized protein MKK02DRAFT_19911 [Dioszegia hungarica]KAI9632388.1 hypothetical protein MKK02DRAFT_19911 [Dioszegia hungarica]